MHFNTVWRLRQVLYNLRENIPLICWQELYGYMDISNFTGKQLSILNHPLG